MRGQFYPNARHSKGSTDTYRAAGGVRIIRSGDDVTDAAKAAAGDDPSSPINGGPRPPVLFSS